MNNEKLVQGSLIIGMIAILAGTALYVVTKFGNFSWSTIVSQPPATLKTFASAEELRTYLQDADDLYSGISRQNVLTATEGDVTSPTLGLGQTDTKTATVDRSSTTNVQVAGIDEPDIVKTNGQQLFISGEQMYSILPAFREPITDLAPPEEQKLKAEDSVSPAPSTGSGSAGSTAAEQSTPPSILPIPTPTAKTSIVQALPASDLKVTSSINQSGEMLLSGQTLVIFAQNNIIGYDVSNPASPTQQWTSTLGNNESLVASRLLNNKLYVVTQSYIQRDLPCPYQPLVTEGKAISIPCTDIYRPSRPIPVDATYTALIINPTSGQVEKHVSFVGSTNSTVVYMSTKSLYLAYTEYGDPVTYQYEFYTSEAKDLLPSAMQTQLQRVQGYDISASSKMNEFQSILEEHQNSLSSAAQQKFQEDLQKKYAEYQKKHRRDFTQTGIVKIDLNDFSVDDTGQVPGVLLNQFSMDEYDGFLRIATTSGPDFFFGGGESVNDVYILDGKMNQTGSVLDLGKGERIYSVRFVKDRGYVVTFKQIDPFYVLDLSDEVNPVMTGELKIPGFSSYLHPLTDTLVLGVGQDNFQVKISLFDVSKANAPTEVSKLLLNESWSEAQNNHHAFLQDEKHKIFFLPAGTKGHIISYDGNTLTDKKTTEKLQAQRAVYINDFLYLIARDRIVVLNENDWSIAKELTL